MRRHRCSDGTATRIARLFLRSLSSLFGLSCNSLSATSRPEWTVEGEHTGSLLLSHDVGSILLGALHLSAAHVVALLLLEWKSVVSEVSEAAKWDGEDEPVRLAS